MENNFIKLSGKKVFKLTISATFDWNYSKEIFYV